MAQSGHAKNAINVAVGGKADMTFCDEDSRSEDSNSVVFLDVTQFAGYSRFA
jgi:hypothetical protein